MQAIADQGLQGGQQYNFPHCDGPEAMKDPAWNEKYTKGPKGFLILMPDGPPDIPQSMVKSTLYNLVMTIFVAYVATMALGPGSPKVFQMTSVVAFLAFGGALGWGPIWFGRTMGSTLREMFDALVYGLATGAIFMWLWPSAETVVGG
jgi:hypothetical protein